MAVYTLQITPSDIFAVIALAVRQPEQAFLENGIFAIPEREGKTEQLLLVADAGQPVLAPVIGSGTRLIVGEVVPGVSVLAVVLANRAPLALTQVGAPFPPRDSGFARLVQPLLFRYLHHVFQSHRSLLLIETDASLAGRM
jgi:hypothetical protein